MEKFSFYLFILISLSISAQQKQPNIIWITCEDISPYIGAYGDAIIQTPNIDRLAEEGVKYTRAYTVAGVCAPSRSSFITGMYPISIGTQHMRTTASHPKYMGEGVPDYSAVVPTEVKAFPELLRRAGYYTSNNKKEDYQFIAPVTVWDESSPAATYRNRPDGRSFFSVFNFHQSHESNQFELADSLYVNPDEVYVPAYYHDTPTTRKDIANMLTNIQIMDSQVGELIAQLKRDGVYENSYIFFFSDHGGNLPWMKREILERGTHIPLIIKLPNNKQAGITVDDLVSGVDFAPTVLSLAGIKLPSYLQGQAFLGKQANPIKRKYVFAARDRMDELYDRVRAVRDTQFRYIYNFMPEKSRYQDLAYRKNIPMMKEILDLINERERNPNAAAWFESPKPLEELYDVKNDPEELHNLAGDPQYTKKLSKLRMALKTWIGEVGDMSEIPEKEMVIELWWKGNKEAPTTAKPEMIQTRNGVKVECATEGASIAYRVLYNGKKETKPEKKIIKTWDGGYRENNGKTLVPNPVWQVYNGKTIRLEEGDKLIVQAMRIGYEPSEIEYVQQ